MIVTTSGTVFGYPTNQGPPFQPADFELPGGSGQYMTWDQVRAQLGNATVSTVYIVADADQPAGTVDTISGVNYAGTNYTS